MGYQFSRKEHLKSRKAIQSLFTSGRYVKAYPLRIQYCLYPDTSMETSRIQAAFVVSKRNFRLAVDRNRIKRLMIEAFRLNKQLLLKELESSNRSIHLMVIYANNTEKEYHQIDKSMQKGIKKLCAEFNK